MTIAAGSAAVHVPGVARGARPSRQGVRTWDEAGPGIGQPREQRGKPDRCGGMTWEGWRTGTRLA